MDNFEYLGPNLPKTGFWGRNSKNLSLHSESACLRFYVHQFSNKANNFEFLGQNLPKNWCWGLNFKNLILDSESTPWLYRVCQFSVKMDNIWFFDLNLGKLPNYVQYFGSNIVEGVAESWVEVDGTGWRWVHSLVIHFDDVFKNLSLAVSYTPVMLHSQWHYWSLHKAYPWYKVPSHVISRSWDTSEERVGWVRVYTPPSRASHAPCMPVYNTCSQDVCPVMLLSWLAASLKVIFRPTCFAYSVFANKFWNTMMNIPRMYLTPSGSSLEAVEPHS